MSLVYGMILWAVFMLVFLAVLLRSPRSQSVSCRGFRLTLTEVAQLFAIGSALAGLVFWSGVLSNRVRNIEKQIEREEPDGKKLVRVEVTLENMGLEIASIKRALEGIQRQLGNLMTGRGGFMESHRVEDHEER